MSGRIIPTAGDHPGPQAPDQPAQRNADSQSAHSDQHERQTGIGQREHTGHRCYQGKLECHQARGIIHQRLALQNVHQRGRQAITGNRRDRHRICRRQHGGQGKRHRQRHSGQQPVDEIAGADHSEQHQPYRQRQDRPAQMPELALGHAPAVGEQQRWQEQKQKQFGIEGNMQSERRPGEQGTGGNLHQWQRQRNHPSDQARDADQHQQDQDGVGGLHKAWFPDNRQH
ncbi:hypothetical protein D3C86_1410810 [compost metagenome]